ncbi:MAG: acyltransferase [Leptonema sp. (in: Bacteria)]|nr:acyltransferase [Leptonema sp. (in: bacteria)]
MIQKLMHQYKKQNNERVLLFNKNSSEIDSLHGLRSISILLIIWLHLYIPAGPFLNVPYSWLDRLFRNFTSGVDLFFILSGFLIYGKLRSTSNLNRQSVKVYFEKRVRRILPAYYVALIGSAIFLIDLSQSLQAFQAELLNQVHRSLSNWWADVFLVSNYVADRLLDLGWSLSLEAHFYITVPLFVYLIQKARLSRIVPLVMLVLLYFVPLGFRFIQIDNNMTYFYTHTRIDSIIAGMVVSEIYYLGWLTKLSNFKSICLLIVSVLLLVIAHVSEIDSFFYRTVRYNFFNVGFSGLLVLSLCSPMIQRPLSIAPFRFLARISYTMYLWHPLLITIVIRQFYIDVKAINLSQIFLIWLFGFCITIAISTLLYLLVEKRFQYSAKSH